MTYYFRDIFVTLFVTLKAKTALQISVMPFSAVRGVLCGKDGEKGRCGAAGEVYSVFVSFGNIRGFEESSFFVYMAIIHQVPS